MRKKSLKVATFTLGVIALAGIGALIAVNVRSGPSHHQQVRIVAPLDVTPTVADTTTTTAPAVTTTTAAPAPTTTVAPVTAPPVTDPPVTAPPVQTTTAPSIPAPVESLPYCTFGWPAGNPIYTPCVDSTTGQQYGYIPGTVHSG